MTLVGERLEGRTDALVDFARAADDVDGLTRRDGQRGAENRRGEKSSRHGPSNLRRGLRDTVLTSTRTPSPMPAAAPSGPQTTARTASSSARDMNVASAV